MVSQIRPFIWKLIFASVLLSCISADKEIKHTVRPTQMQVPDLNPYEEWEGAVCHS